MKKCKTSLVNIWLTCVRRIHRWMKTGDLNWWAPIILTNSYMDLIYYLKIKEPNFHKWTPAVYSSHYYVQIYGQRWFLIALKDFNRFTIALDGLPTWFLGNQNILFCPEIINSLEKFHWLSFAHLWVGWKTSISMIFTVRVETNIPEAITLVCGSSRGLYLEGFLWVWAAWIAHWLIRGCLFRKL